VLNSINNPEGGTSDHFVERRKKGEDLSPSKQKKKKETLEHKKESPAKNAVFREKEKRRPEAACTAQPF